MYRHFKDIGNTNLKIGTDMKFAYLKPEYISITLHPYHEKEFRLSNVLTNLRQLMVSVRFSICQILSRYE